MQLKGDFLVSNVSTNDRKLVGPLLVSDVSLSFWGGIDPLTGIIIDTSHPLAGKCVSDTILCLPSGRGSCTASQVLLELILNKTGPSALVLRDVDPLACVGAIVAQEIFDLCVLPILQLGDVRYRSLLDAVASSPQSSSLMGAVSPDGHLYLGESATDFNVPAETSESLRKEIILTAEEERRLDECANEAERLALNVMFKYARLTSKEPSYVSVSQAHIVSATIREDFMTGRWTTGDVLVVTN